MILRSKSCSDFWKRLQVQSIKRGRVEQALNERKSKRIKNKNEIFPEEKDEKLDGLQSVGTTIKKQSSLHLLNHKYSELDDNEKCIVSNGFNSILDFTDNRKSSNHKALFTKNQWAMLQQKWLKKIAWKELGGDVVCDLKEIEEAAILDLKTAYALCLQKRAEHAFTEKEKYFEVYSNLMQIMHRNPKVLSSNNNSCLTEADYVVKIWSKIFEAVFGDGDMFCVWDESVNKESSAAKTGNKSTKTLIGDKVDGRVCTKGPLILQKPWGIQNSNLVNKT